jgi:hypothetical protein
MSWAWEGGVKIRGQVRVDDLGSASPQLGADGVYRLPGLAARAVSVARFVEVGFEYGLKQQQQRHLHDAVFDVGDSEGALFAVGLGYPDAFDRAGLVAVLLQVALELVEDGGEVGFRLARAHRVLSGRACVLYDRLGGGLQQVAAAQVAGEAPCAPAFVFLRFAP